MLAMEKSNVLKTRDLDLCVSCEICSAACSQNAIAMEYKLGQFLPKVDNKKCIECGLCLEICPGIDVDHFGLRYQEISNNMFDGPYLNCYTAYSNNPDIRINSTSGGLITTLIIELIRNKDFDAAFVLLFDTFNHEPARLKATSGINEISNSAKSKYVPASVYEVIMALKNQKNSKYIIVGTPCQILGIKKYLRKNELSEKNLFFLGLFCDKTLNFNIIRYFEDRYSRPNEKLIKFDFRTKEKYGWPGNSKLYFDSGRELIVDKSIRVQLKTLFQLKRCLFCLDKLNRCADISFGDCYIKGKEESRGKSTVIIRTKKGEEIFTNYSYLFTFEKSSMGAIRQSQQLEVKTVNLENVKTYVKELDLYPDSISDYESNSQVVRRLSKLSKYMVRGKNYDFNKIRWFEFTSKIEKKLSTARKLTILAALLGRSIVVDIFFRGRSKKGDDSRKLTPGNIIIVGGSLFNKGAQAMTFTTVDQLKRRVPDKNIYLFSAKDFGRDDEEKRLYTFNILPWDVDIKFKLLGFGGTVLGGNNYLEHIEYVRTAIQNAEYIIDISGYALSSQSGLVLSGNYLLDIIIAKKYSVPYYIFPQSIGPFKYPAWQKFILYPLMYLYLKYPEKIFVREEEGLNCVRKFTKKNVEKRYDIVLQNIDYDIANIFKKEFTFKYIKIEPNSVGIIPNSRVFERAKPNKLYSMYRSLINRLLVVNKTVYILRHSYEDLEICEKLKSFFSDNINVRHIFDDLNAIELEHSIKQFDFIIASRYHSLIHSYKNGVPALVIGWATKYHELLKNFDQLDYYFDARKNIDVNVIDSKLDKMIQNYIYEHEKIIDKVNSLRGETVFDIFGVENSQQ